MTRTDTHIDGMLRHLGAAYYESLHGRATQADVTRAVDTVTEHLNERPAPRAASDAGAGADAGQPAGVPGLAAGSRGWSRRVGDVMATAVITVDRATPYKEIARLLAEHRISGVPVLKMGREVAGVVTEADLLAASAKTARRLRPGGHLSLPLRAQRDRQHLAPLAGGLMTAPAITVGPHVTVQAAGRLMAANHIRLLPVVDEHGVLIGVVSRRDLLTLFLRPDEDIAADVHKVLDEVLHAEPEEADVAVHDGVVTLTGTLDPTTGTHGDLIPVAIRLMLDVDGVVDVIDHLGQPAAGRPVPATEGQPSAEGQPTAKDL